MNYVQLSFNTAAQQERDLLIALLSDFDVEGFEETEDGLLAFVQESDYNASAIRYALQPFELPFTASMVEKVNWNRQWEENFSPVVVADFCTIRADFHILDVQTLHEIVITPKMSFGTGHHATTQLMIAFMQEFSFRGTTVFDFGTGTGILAILAHKLGAKSVLAVDNDEWSFENAKENAARNEANEIDIVLGGIAAVGSGTFDIILANINRHILLQYMQELHRITKAGGTVLMSGLLAEDQDVIVRAAQGDGLRFERMKEEGNWIALLFSKA